MYSYEVNDHPFLLTPHFIHLAFRDVTYPITKDVLIKLTGQTIIPVAHDVEVPFIMILDNVEVTEFNCASQLYCAILAAIYKIQYCDI